MPSYRGLSTVVFTTDLGEQHPFASQEPHCSPILLYILATCWSRANRTDGEIPKATIRRLASWHPNGPTVEACAAELVSSGVWEAQENGCFFDNSYKSMQVTNEELLKNSDRQREKRLGDRQSTGGEPAVNQQSTVCAPQFSSVQISSDQFKEETITPASPGVVREPKPRKPPTGDHPELMALFVGLFEGVTGSKPTIGAKDGAAMARMLRAHGREVIEDRMKRCFEQRAPAWAWREGPPTLSCFLSASVFDKLTTVAPAPNEYRTYSNGRASAMSFLTDP